MCVCVCVCNSNNTQTLIERNAGVTLNMTIDIMTASLI